jgi:hypothetical protein
MTWILIFCLIGGTCENVSFETEAGCQGARVALEQDAAAKHVDVYATCVRKT